MIAEKHNLFFSFPFQESDDTIIMLTQGSLSFTASLLGALTFP